MAPEAATAALAEQARSGRLDPECVRAVIQAAGQPPPKVRTVWPAGLSDREVEVLGLVAEGLTDGQVARELRISPRTVGRHLGSIYRKLDVPSRAAAARKAVERGLIQNGS